MSSKGMADNEEKELRAYVERWRLASAKFEELRRKDLRNVNVAEHIEAMNGAFKAALATQTRTTSGLVEQQAIFAKIRDARTGLAKRSDTSRKQAELSLDTADTTPFEILRGSGPGEPRPQKRTKRVVRNGAATNELVLSAYDEGNERIFPRILALYVKPGSIIADVTHGKGVFWRNVPSDTYDLRATDIQDGIDCRDLPYADGSIDCVVLDPPYMHTPGGTAHQAHPPFEKYYANNRSKGKTGAKYHEAVLELYREAACEAFRVLRHRGVFIVKCQDEVCANRQRFTHVEIMETCRDMNFVAEDLFVVIRNNRPGVSRVVKQVHARKNHSYFLVFWKSNGRDRLWEAPS